MAVRHASNQEGELALDPPREGAPASLADNGTSKVRHWQLFWGVGTSEGVAELRAGTGRQRRRQSRAVGSGDSPDVEQVGTCHSGCWGVGMLVGFPGSVYYLLDPAVHRCGVSESPSEETCHGEPST